MGLGVAVMKWIIPKNSLRKTHHGSKFISIIIPLYNVIYLSVLNHGQNHRRSHYVFVTHVGMSPNSVEIVRIIRKAALA